MNLAALEPWARRSAIEQMPTTMRLALLQFMLETRPQKAKKLVKATARPAKDTTKRAVFVATAAVAGQTPGLPKLCIKGIKGVRYVPTGLYQASIGYANLMIRSRTSRSLVHAQQLYAALRRFRALAKQEGACRGDVLLEEVLERAREQALAEVGISEEDLRPSFCVSISTGTWAGKVESPTTTSLRGALAWRRRLLDAKQVGWPKFRAEWVAILQEAREGASAKLSLVDAEARVDEAAKRRGGAARGNYDASDSLRKRALGSNISRASSAPRAKRMSKALAARTARAARVVARRALLSARVQDRIVADMHKLGHLLPSTSSAPRCRRAEDNSGVPHLSLRSRRVGCVAGARGT